MERKNLITFSIYGLVVMSHISEEINVIAFKRDGKHTMHFIAPLVWAHRISNRIGAELTARGCNYSFGASDFWLWNILGALIVIGPFVYKHKQLKAMNLLNADYLSQK